MRFFPTILRSSFIFLCLWLGTPAVAAAPSHAHRYPDAVVAMVWTPTGERWIRLEQAAPGYYHGSVEFASCRNQRANASIHVSTADDTVTADHSVARHRGMPIRLLPTPTKCRVVPFSRVEPVEGRRCGPAGDSEQ